MDFSGRGPVPAFPQGPGQAASFGAAHSKFMPAPKVAGMQTGAAGMPMQTDMYGGSPQLGKGGCWPASPGIRPGTLGGCGCGGSMGGLPPGSPGKGGCMPSGAGMGGAHLPNGSAAGFPRPNGMQAGLIPPGAQMQQNQFDPSMVGQQFNYGAQVGHAKYGSKPMVDGMGMASAGLGGCGQMGQMGYMSRQPGAGLSPTMGGGPAPCMGGKGAAAAGMMSQGLGGASPLGCGGGMGCAGQSFGMPGQHMGRGGCGQQFGARAMGGLGGYGPVRTPGMIGRPPMGGLPYKSPPPMPEPGVGVPLNRPPMGGGVKPGDEFGTRLSQLRKEFSHLDLEIPPDIRTWSLEELEAYFRSGGINRPVSTAQKPVEQPAPTIERTESQTGKTPRKRPAEGALEYSVAEAQEIQTKLREQFADASFQTALKELNEGYPERKNKGHADRSAFFEAFEALTLSVHAKVLPSFGISADWNGVREMMSRMTEAMKHPKVKKLQEEINVLMGLPRDAEFAPPPKEEEMFQYRPNADAVVPEYTQPMVVDDDGDTAHEFLVEDMVTGELRQRGPTALAGDSPAWYLVLQKPAAVIRAKPDVNSDMVGRKKTGKHIRGQRVLGDKWVQLHSSEVVKLGVQEAWVMLTGSEDGTGNEPLLERVPM